MSSRPNGADGPEDIDAAFAEIVAGLEREGPGPTWPDQNTSSQQTDSPPVADATTVNDPGGDRPSSRGGEHEWELAAGSDEEHYVPPDPPPLPRLRPATITAVLLMVVGLLLLIAPGLTGLAPRIATPLALISLTCGIGWLVLRTRQGPPPDSGWDDGAQL